MHSHDISSMVFIRVSSTFTLSWLNRSSFHFSIVCSTSDFKQNAEKPYLDRFCQIQIFGLVDELILFPRRWLGLVFVLGISLKKVVRRIEQEHRAKFGADLSAKISSAAPSRVSYASRSFYQSSTLLHSPNGKRERVGAFKGMRDVLKRKAQDCVLALSPNDNSPCRLLSRHLLEYPARLRTGLITLAATTA